MTSLVLPAFNPGPSIEQTWLAVRQFLDARALRSERWEALFVLDGCTDGTEERLLRLNGSTESASSPIRVLSYADNRGKGHAVRFGMLAAKGELRIFTDVDLAYPFEDVVRVARTLEAGAEVAVGSRLHSGSRIELPTNLLSYVFRRFLQGRIFGAVARFLLPISMLDTQAGLKGMTADVAESLLPHMDCDGFGFDCEFLTACARAAIPLVEVPVCVRYDATTSTTGPRAGLRMLQELWRIRRSWRSKAIPLVRTRRNALAEVELSQKNEAA